MQIKKTAGWHSPGLTWTTGLLILTARYHQHQTSQTPLAHINTQPCGWLEESPWLCSERHQSAFVNDSALLINYSQKSNKCLLHWICSMLIVCFNLSCSLYKHKWDWQTDICINVHLIRRKQKEAEWEVWLGANFVNVRQGPEGWKEEDQCIREYG